MWLSRAANLLPSVEYKYPDALNIDLQEHFEERYKLQAGESFAINRRYARGLEAQVPMPKDRLQRARYALVIDSSLKNVEVDNVLSNVMVLTLPLSKIPEMAEVMFGMFNPEMQELTENLLLHWKEILPWPCSFYPKEAKLDSWLLAPVPGKYQCHRFLHLCQRRSNGDSLPLQFVYVYIVYKTVEHSYRTACRIFYVGSKKRMSYNILTYHRIWELTMKGSCFNTDDSSNGINHDHAFARDGAKSRHHDWYFMKTSWQTTRSIYFKKIKTSQDSSKRAKSFE